MKKLLIRAATSLAAFTPVVALAQYGQINTEIAKVVTFINNVLIPLIFAIALLVFVWGMFKFFIYNTEEEKEKGKELAIYAIVAFVLMVSIWGIVNLVANGLGFAGENIDQLPSGPFIGGGSYEEDY